MVNMMAGPHYYYNSLGTKVSTITPINLCTSKGALSHCSAISIDDQHGCKYREPSSNGKHCMYWREDTCGACDSVWAQTSKENPNKKKE